MEESPTLEEAAAMGPLTAALMMGAWVVRRVAVVAVALVALVAVAGVRKA